MPTLIAATKLFIASSLPIFFNALHNATVPPVMDAVLVPPSA